MDTTPPTKRAAAALAACLALASFPAQACWEQAAAWYHVNPHLLYAIAKTESGLNPAAINRSNKNGSYDIGLMQINSRWLPTLKKYGVEEKDLYDACTSIQVGAWILAQNMQRMGVTWEAVGAYNARDPALRIKYAMKVHKNLPSAALDDQSDAGDGAYAAR
jgi:soluble lytic murein transglycosylase-like protein